LQTEADARSDPSYNSDDGYETRYMNPSDEKEIVKYQTDNALDSDVIATQKHFREEEKKTDHKFDPVKFLAQTKTADDFGDDPLAPSEEPAPIEAPSMAQ